MKTRKLGVMSTTDFGISSKTRRRQILASVLRLVCKYQGSGIILLLILEMIAPGCFGAKAIAHQPTQVSDNAEPAVVSQELAQAQPQDTANQPVLFSDNPAPAVVSQEEAQAQPQDTANQPTLFSDNAESAAGSQKVAEVDETISSPTTAQPQTTAQEPIAQPQPTVAPHSSANNKIQIEIAPLGDPRVQADGRSTIKLQGQITDAEGQLLTEDVLVTLTSSAGKFIGADQDKDQGGFQVWARGGEFIATLQSDIKPQQVRIRAAVEKIKQRSLNLPTETSIDRDAAFPQQTDTSLISQLSDTPIEGYTQVEFTTFLRPSLTTGIVNLRIGARGTDYWGSFRDFLNPDRRGGTQVDFSAAVFSTGKVGDWLFTGAFNSKRPINEDCEGNNRLFGGIQFCEQQYPVYGDSSSFTPTTPSIDSFYARFERSSSIPGAEPDYFMWGDYDTQEFNRSSQLYTATSRQLHGFKANYNLGPFQITGLFANNIEGFQRDTIVPNGTSGNYFLSKRLLVPGSETVYLESEEINRPGTVVARQQLFRGSDYEIDYDRGTLLFRRPILATELNPFGTTLVKRIVATYQNEGGQDAKLYGGRLQYNFSQDLATKSFLGASYLLEDQGSQDFRLFGSDFLLSFGNALKIVGEYARSNSSLLNGEKVNGSAYRIEAFGNLSDRLLGQAYYRAVEPNFSNNATFSFTPGQTRYGGSLLAKVTDTTSLSLAYDFEENYGTSATSINPLVGFFDLFDPQPQARPGQTVNNTLKTFRAGILQRLGPADVSLEYVNRSRTDRITDQFSGEASQLVSRLKLPLSEALTFQAQNELNLGGNDPLYPNRTTLGLDWKAYPGVTFRLAHQFFDKSSLIPGNSITTLDTILDRKLSEDTTLTGRYSVLSAFNGLQGQGAVGLNHRWAIAPGLRVNLGYQYIFKNIFNATASGNQFGQYYAIGQTASSLGLFAGSVYSIGLEYTDNPDFQASTRFEYRDGDEANNLVISAAAAGKISPALTALVRYQQAGESNIYLPASSLNPDGIRLQELGDTANLKIGLAYRDPSNDKFNALLKYEWRQNFDSIPETQLTGSTATGHIFSAEAIYAPNWRWEFYGKYAFRNGITFLDGDRFDASANLAQLRATYRLGYRTDLAVEGRWIGQNSNSGTNYNEFGVALETGYYLTPDLRVAVGYSFGSVDDRDFSGYRSEGGFYANITFKLNELLGGFGLQKPVPKQQQESAVEAKAPIESPKGTDTSQNQVINTSGIAAEKTSESETSQVKSVNSEQ